MKLLFVPLDQITTDPKQPRRIFDQPSLIELSQSIKKVGVIQPVLLEKIEGGYLLEAGERRYRAAHIAGLQEIPALVVPANDGLKRIRQLVENIQRDQLDPMDIAHAITTQFQKLRIDEVAVTLGKSIAWVSKKRALFNTSPENLKLMREVTCKDGELLYLLSALDKIDPRTCTAMLLSLKGDSGAFGRAAVKKAIARAKNRKYEAVDPLQVRVDEWAGDNVDVIASPFGRGGRGVRVQLTFPSTEDFYAFLSSKGGGSTS